VKTLALFLFLFLTASAASAQYPEGIWQGYDGEWKHVSQQLIALAEATRADKFSWLFCDAHTPASSCRQPQQAASHL